MRNRAVGRYTALEWTSEFLRNHVWGGEEIVGLVRKEFFSDHFVEKGMAATTSASAPAGLHRAGLASVGIAGYRQILSVGLHPKISTSKLGQPKDTLIPGRWYPARGVSGVYVSFIQPQMISSKVLESYPGVVNKLDSVEASALDYLVAFDLAEFDLGFALGTDHPGVGWSDRPAKGLRAGLPGPDGINSVAPLVSNGMISPILAARTIATFTGGFKREHGAFRYGAFAKQNRGTHYGFVEQGVVFSKLLPGLATLYTLDDGTVEMKTWADADNALLPRMKFARQNGVPLIEHDSATNTSIPGLPGRSMGTRQLVGLRGGGIAVSACRSLPSGDAQSTLSGVRLLLDGHPIRDGTGISGV